MAILPNNPRIDPAEVEARARQLVAGTVAPSAPAGTASAVQANAPVAPREAEPTAASPAGAPAPPPAGGEGAAPPPVAGGRRRWASERWARLTAPGVRLRDRITALPVLGDLVYLAWVLLDLPRFRAAIAASADGLSVEQAHQRARIDELYANQASEKAAVRGALDRLARDLADLRDATRQRLASQDEAFMERIALLQDRLALQRRALRLLEQRAAGTSAPAAKEAGPESPPAALGNFYLEFESRFRGSRAEIKERQRAYLSRVQAAVRGVDRPRCVDIGCGRGEWLELLGEMGLAAKGIDLDPGMVAACRERGLDVELGDGLAWLRSQPEGSVDVVSAFQVIEHLGFTQWVGLLDATLRALSPDGIAIFETPNPENLLVGACNFYYDPTHRHPIPPVVAAFVAEQRGFARVEILRVNAYPEHMHLRGDDEATRRLNGLLYGPQDYALVVGNRHAA